MGTIFVTSGEGKGNYYPLGHRTTVIGRAEQLPIQILDDRVSRKHMKIHYNSERERYSAVDYNSRHGVFINGTKIDRETLLNDADEIHIGDTSLMFTEEDFTDLASAMRFYKKVGERDRPTVVDE